MSSRYDELSAVYATAKAEFDGLETRLAVARAKMRAAEREAVTEWRRLTDTDKLDALTRRATGDR